MPTSAPASRASRSYAWLKLCTPQKPVRTVETPAQHRSPHTDRVDGQATNGAKLLRYGRVLDQVKKHTVTCQHTESIGIAPPEQCDIGVVAHPSLLFQQSSFGTPM